MSHPQQAAIVFEHVSFIPQGKEVFTDFSLCLNAADKTVVRGPSGSGKSTLLYILLGITLPHCGTVSIYGREVNERNCWEMRRHLAYLPQKLAIFENTGREFMDHIFSLERNRHQPPAKGKLSELLDYFELTDNHLDSPAARLSGGELQRLGLIAAILLDRNIMLLDEPTSALDSNMKKKIIDWVRRESEKTILIISHDEIWNQHYNEMRIINWKLDT